MKNHKSSVFGDEIAFLKQHIPVLMLEDQSSRAKIAIAPSLQARVLTSTASGDSGQSFGWINCELIASGERRKQINAFGGEDRFWLGPEGGQFSLFFNKGALLSLKTGRPRKLSTGGRGSRLEPPPAAPLSAKNFRLRIMPAQSFTSSPDAPLIC
ncbi:MAG: DUF6786 family protein [Victivallaceae bacterium]